MEKIIIDVHGRVQGVFFRHNTRKRAKRWNLKGYVQNMPDGSVHIEAVGKEENLNKLLKFAKKGPRLARVDDIEYTYEESSGEFDGFTVRY
ncbi:MAG: acylphosphatase [Candidatus Lokiarchaeota archaeon]|nr:acylphosphatase [Candidatus Lokiarchaeota archaeon]MBD3200475.1 acylphosphatase [Candidatus Lokiarchaeota archaeon]